MKEYVVMDCADGEMNWRRFSSNSEAQAFVEENVNDLDWEGHQFVVFTCEHFNPLSVLTSKRITVSLGGM